MESQEATDILLLRNGDKAAFKRLYDHYWAKVHHFAKLYLDDPWEQEEAVQQVFIRLWDKRTRLDPEKGIDGYLFITTRNLIFNRRHHSLNEKALKEALAAEADFAQPPETDLNELKSHIEALVGALPPRQREAFELSRTEGLSYREIAKKMGISEKGVERHIHLALKFIKTSLPLFIIYLNY